MKVNLLKISTAIVSWFFWAVGNLLILPAGMLLLLICLAFIHDKTTPGQLIVGVIKNADNVTDGFQWKWRQCLPTQKLPDLEGSGNVKTFVPQPKPILSAECPEVISDGAGYASYIDRTMMSILGMLWAVFAFCCIGLSILLRRYPHNTIFPIRTESNLNT